MLKANSGPFKAVFAKPIKVNSERKKGHNHGRGAESKYMSRLIEHVKVRSAITTPKVFTALCIGYAAANIFIL